MNLPPFSVNWDYLCPFARNAHENLVCALEGGAPWEVTFTPFSLMQTHVEEGEEAVWERDEPVRGLLALQAGVVARDRFPDRFRAAHLALFAARHDRGEDLASPTVVREAVASAGIDPDQLFKEVEKGWPLEAVRHAHEEAVKRYETFGVPTFVFGDTAAFVRLMTRPGGDVTKARRVIEHIGELLAYHPEVNELKHTTIPR